MNTLSLNLVAMAADEHNSSLHHADPHWLPYGRCVVICLIAV